MSKRINISSAAASRIRPNKCVDFSPTPSTPYTKKWALRSIVPTHCKIEKCIISTLFLLPNYFSNWQINCSKFLISICKNLHNHVKINSKTVLTYYFTIVQNNLKYFYKRDFWSHPQKNEQNHCHSTFHFGWNVEEYWFGYFVWVWDQNWK